MAESSLLRPGFAVYSASALWWAGDLTVIVLRERRVTEYEGNYISVGGCN
jgi:hypothetical protein